MAKGLCPKCGNPTKSKYAYCTPCATAIAKLRREKLTPEQLKIDRDKARLRYQNLSDAERKRRNEKHRQWKSNLSPEHLAEYKEGRRQYAKTQRKLRPEFFAEEDRLSYAENQKKLNLGLCTMTNACPETIAGTTRFCIHHWIMVIAAAGNRRNKLKVHYSAVLALWNSQNEHCAVTGLKLIPGTNAHLDHIIPVGKGGEHVIGNLRFVHETFNRMKDDLLDSDLKEFLRSAIPALAEWSK